MAPPQPPLWRQPCINLKYKYDEKLFRRDTRNAGERRLTECLFADDGALLSTTRPGTDKGATEFQQASTMAKQSAL